MFIFQQVTDIRYYLDTKRLANIEIGLVPTMGALHNGHLSLIKQSKKQTGLTVCSIFINPTQFNDQKDYEKYPVTIHQDIHMLLKAGCDVLFLPSANILFFLTFWKTEAAQLLSKTAARWQHMHST